MGNGGRGLEGPLTRGPSQLGERRPSLEMPSLFGAMPSDSDDEEEAEPAEETAAVEE
jgi:hypothetical protein